MQSTKDTYVKQGFRTTQIGITGVWLLVLYPVLLWVIVGTLSGYGFQDKVALSKSKDSINKRLTIPAIILISKQLKEKENQESALRKELKGIEDEAEKARNAHGLAREKRDVWETKWDSLEKEIIPKLRHLHNNNESNLPLVLEHKSDIGVHLETYSTNLSIVKLKPRYMDLVTTQKEIEREFRNTKENLSKMNELVELKDFELSEVNEDVIALLKKDNVGDFITELDYMSDLKFEMFATMPSQLLTLMLTLSMGALGSLIFITLDYFLAGSNRTFSWYLFRPFLGMATAVAIFVLAKAGQLTISDASASNSISENLNPFFISFLGIVSGLLSEQATERIRTAGQAVFRTDKDNKKEPDRWAVGFEAEVKSQNKSVKDLLQFISVPEVTVEKWVAESLPVPAEEQRIIASWLGVPARNLFTDLRPATTVDEKQ